MWATVQIGNNVYTGAAVARSAIVIDGIEAIVIASDPAVPYLLVWLDLFDVRGGRVARMRRTEWVGSQTAYEYARAPRRVIVRTVEPRRPILDVAFRPDEASLVVRYADLNTPARRRLVIDEVLGVVISDPFTGKATSSAAHETCTRSLARMTIESAASVWTLGE